MSTSGNLPAGQFTTQINGKQCTAIPRSDIPPQSSSTPVVVSNSAEAVPPPAAAAAATTTSVVQETTSSSLEVQTQPSSTPPTTFSTSTTAAAISIPSTTEAIPIPAVATPSVSTESDIETSSSAPLLPSSRTSTAATSATPASKGTTPTVSTRTSVPPIALSEITTSSTPTPLAITAGEDGSGDIAPSTTASFADAVSTAPSQAQSSAAGGISSSPKLETAPVVGGVLGSIALIAVVGVIFWFCRRRRRRRDSLLTPLTGGGGDNEKSFYEIDNGSVGPTKRSDKWRAEVGYRTGKISSVVAGVKSGIAGIGSSLKSKVVGDRSDTPSVNLNRGNSQFIDGPIPQHSRNNSLLSNTTHLTTKDRFNDWWDRFTDNVTFNWIRRRQIEPADPFAAARSVTEKQANVSGQPNFSQLLGIDDREMQNQADRRRASLTSSIPNLGSLGLDFESHDPFADPTPPKSQNTAWKPPKPGALNKSNPFADPITQPGRTIPKSQTYISDIRRSRGQSIDATNNTSAYTATNAAYRPPSTAVTSRYPSTIAPSRDSYRDTLYSSFSTNVRKGKGRSDPFDLERPELWRPKEPPMPNSNRISTRPRGGSMAENVDLYPNPLHPNPLRMSSVRGAPVGQVDSNGAQPRTVSVGVPRVVSNATYASKYSSGVSSMGDWGDPGPDLGPGSANSSLRGNASSNGSGDFTFGATDARAIYGGGEGVIQGSLAEIQSQRDRDNVSPISLESKSSSKGGVGKAM